MQVPAGMTSADTQPSISPIAISRCELYFWLFLVSLANGLFPIISKEVALASEPGALLASATNLFGISAVVIAAMAVALHMLATGPSSRSMSKADHRVAVVALMAALLPQGWLSWVAISLVSLHLIRSSGAASSERRAAIILLAVAGSLFWGRLLLNLLSPQILKIDAAFVAQLTGVQQFGNILPAVDGSKSFIVANGCSSLHGMSVAIVLWATMGQLMRVRLSAAYIAFGIAAAMVTLALNVARISAIVMRPDYYHFLHEGPGATVFSWIGLIVVAVICFLGARNDDLQPS